MSRRDRERRDEYASATKWAETAGSGEFTSISIPEGMKLFKPKPGKYSLDLLPYRVGKGNPQAEKGQKYFERTYYVHGFCVGPNNETHVCLAKTYGERCPVCQKREELTMEPDNKATTDKMKPKRRQLFLVVDRDNAPKEVQLYDTSFATFGEALAEVVKDPEAGGSPDFFRSDEDGKTLRVTYKEESGGEFNYTAATRIDLIARKKGIASSLLEELPCLDDLLKPLSYKELKELMEGGGKDEDDEDEDQDDEDEDQDDDEDDRPSKKKTKSRKSDDEDEEEEEYDEDEEEEDEPPRKSPKKKSRRDEDDEDEEDQDDDDDPPPKSRKDKKKPAKKKRRDEDDEDEDYDIPF